uniref:Uncharacterized protein n=1 Tax=Anguilla anguilla TaxID=7936 RepID=A0A0E9XJC4_ANGAN
MLFYNSDSVYCFSYTFYKLSFRTNNMSHSGLVHRFSNSLV